jgi:hypothetical protein
MEVAAVSFEIFTFPALTAVVVSLAIFACRFLLASFVFCFFVFLGFRRIHSVLLLFG